MKIAIPTAGGKVCMHFGHCEKFALIEADVDKKTIGSITELDPPPHEPGVLPRWLAEQGANIVIAGGMGQRAQLLFEEQNIAVITGASGQTPREIAEAYLNNTLETGGNTCDH